MTDFKKEYRGRIYRGLELAGTWLAVSPDGKYFYRETSFDTAPISSKHVYEHWTPEWAHFEKEVTLDFILRGLYPDWKKGQ